MREQFEKLPEIAERLKRVWWNEDRDQYCDTGKHPSSNGAFLNGAWYAYQEQQKKIDAVLGFLSGYDQIDIENSVNLRDCVNEIQELLK